MKFLFVRISSEVLNLYKMHQFKPASVPFTFVRMFIERNRLSCVVCDRRVTMLIEKNCIARSQGAELPLDKCIGNVMTVMGAFQICETYRPNVAVRLLQNPAAT